jgi:hypothetical protein
LTIRKFGVFAMTTFNRGTLVWAKMRGFPWWPSKIEDENSIPKHVLAGKPTDNSIPVFFFGSNDLY